MSITTLSNTRVLVEFVSASLAAAMCGQRALPPPPAHCSPQLPSRRHAALRLRHSPAARGGARAMIAAGRRRRTARRPPRLPSQVLVELAGCGARPTNSATVGTAGRAAHRPPRHAVIAAHRRSPAAARGLGTAPPPPAHGRPAPRQSAAENWTGGGSPANYSRRERCYALVQNYNMYC